jgi:anti-anti-sigma factor
MNDFKFSREQTGDVLVLRPEGYFNEQSGLTLRNFIREQTPAATRKFVVNLRCTTVINSPGITQLLELAEEIVYDLKGRLVLVGVSELYQEVFQVIGLSAMVETCGDEKSALNLLQK